MILAQVSPRFVFDLDGVLWRDRETIPGAPETVRRLREAGKRLCFVTNNSSRPPAEYAKRLAEIGAGGDETEVVTSADATQRLLEERVPGLRGRAVYVIGEVGLREALAGVGLRILEGNEGVDASIVVVGWDRRLTYGKLRIAATAIARGAIFVATNADPTYPAPGGPVPGTGATVAALRTATGRDPLVAGKPHPTMMALAAERLGGEPALAVGDRPDSDVAAAHAAGWPAALVLTGGARIPELAAAPSWPEFILLRLPHLLEDLPHPGIRAATGPDLPHIASLLHDGGLPAGAARERVGRTVVAEADRRIIATAAWEPAGEDAIIRSVAVAGAHQGIGLGVAITAAAVRGAAEAGHRTAYLATVDAAGFFARWGFEEAPWDAIPDGVAEHPHLSRECPPQASVLLIRIPARPATGGSEPPSA